MQNKNEILLSENYQFSDCHSQIVLYQADNILQLEVRLDKETVWLTQAQIAELFGVKQPAISKHLKSIFISKELDEKSVYSILEYTAGDGKIYQTKFYNLDAIISVGYRVNSVNATQFRIWATQTLKSYIMNGYAIRPRIELLEHRVTETEKKIDFFVRTALPPNEGIFYDGQIFDAYKFVSDLVMSAKTSIVLIDNYIDETVLTLFSNRKKSVSATIYTESIKAALELALQKHNAQYPAIAVKIFERSHDRFLIIDGNVYHIGASLKDLGKRWFAFSKMTMPADDILQRL